MTLSITDLVVTVNIMTLGICSKCHYGECRYAKCHVLFFVLLNVMLSVVFQFFLCWMSLCWVSLCWVSLCWVAYAECRLSWNRHMMLPHWASVKEVKKGVHVCMEKYLQATKQAVLNLFQTSLMMQRHLQVLTVHSLISWELSLTRVTLNLFFNFKLGRFVNMHGLHWLHSHLHLS